MNANNNLEQLLERAQEALISRDFQLAARLFKTILKDKPNDINALQNLGTCYVKANQDRFAEIPFKTILKLQPNNFDALLNLGGIYRRLGEYDESVKMLESALKQDKNTTEVNYNLGHTYKLMGHLDAAADSFLSVIEENPSDVLAYNHLGAIQAARGEHTKALQTYWRGLQIDQNHPILHYNSARSFIALKKYDEAANSFESVFKTKPGWAEALVEYAELLIAKKKLSKAEEVLSQGLLINPKNLLITNKLGKVYYQLGDTKKAEEAYEFVYSQDENNKSTLKGLSKVYEKTERFAEAGELLKKLTSLDPDDKKSGLRYCKALINQNKLEQAEWQLERYKAEDPNDLELLNLEAQYYIKTKQPESEVACYDKLRSIKSDYIDYLLDCGKQHSKLGNYERAKLLLTKYLAFEPNNSEALQALGQNAENQEKLDEALSYFQEAAVHQPKNPTLLDGLSRISAKTKLDRQSVEMVTDLVNQTTQEAPAEFLQDTLKLYEQSINALEPQPNPLEEDPTLELEDGDIGFPEDEFEDFKTTSNPHFDDLLTMDMSEDINFENHDEFSIDLENSFDELDNEKSSLKELVDRDLPLDFVPTRKSREEPINFGDFANSDFMPNEFSEDIEVVGDFNANDEVDIPDSEDLEPDPEIYERQPVAMPVRQQMANPYPPIPPQPKPVAVPAMSTIPTPVPEPVAEELPTEQDEPETADLPIEQAEKTNEDDFSFDGEPMELETPSEELEQEEPLEIETEEESLEPEEEPLEIETADEEFSPDDETLELEEPESEIVEPETDETPLEDDLLEDELLDESEDETQESDAEDELLSSLFDDDDLSGEEALENSFFDDEPAEGEPTDNEQSEPVKDSVNNDDFNTEEKSDENSETADDSAVEEESGAIDTIEENPQRIEAIVCNTVNHIMSKMAPQKPTQPQKNTAQMINDLRSKYKSLSEQKQNELIKSLERLKLDYVIARLKQKPGLLGAASAILETGGFKKQLPNKHVNGKGLLKAVDDLNLN